jgi:glycosyltransferase involved in cell wall biosynthesis
MSLSGRKNAIKFYNWDVISKKYLEVFQKYKS